MDGFFVVNLDRLFNEIDDFSHVAKVILLMANQDSPSQLALEYNIMRVRTDHLTFTTVTFVVLLMTLEFGCRNIAGQVVTRQEGAVTSNTVDKDTSVTNRPSDSLGLACTGLPLKPIRIFYERRQERCFWTSHRSFADSVIDFIGNIRYYGLLRDDYHFVEIETLQNELGSVDNIFRFEALLTDAYISMVKDIWLGKTTDRNLYSDSVAISLLEDASLNGGIINNIISLEPSFPGYQSLKTGLRHFIDSLPEAERTEVLLNSPLVPESYRMTMQTIEVNLERWRSERASFANRYIFINIPAFALYVVEDDSVILESSIIVGTPETPTPELTSKIECFITYPYWHVPRKIATEEYLPLIQNDRGFIERNNFDVLDKKGNALNPDSVAWGKFNKNYFPVLLRQREGPENALGILKFVFDNPYAVFLHDTNAKRLFSTSVRAFSHGCIRMEKAVQLSHYLVTGDLNRKSKYVSRFLEEEVRHSIELERPMPIYVRYYTCEFSNGGLRFYKDIYTKDKLLMKKLYAATASADP